MYHQDCTARNFQLAEPRRAESRYATSRQPTRQASSRGMSTQAKPGDISTQVNLNQTRLAMLKPVMSSKPSDYPAQPDQLKCEEESRRSPQLKNKNFD